MSPAPSPARGNDSVIRECRITIYKVRESGEFKYYATTKGNGPVIVNPSDMIEDVFKKLKLVP